MDTLVGHTHVSTSSCFMDPQSFHGFCPSQSRPLALPSTLPGCIYTSSKFHSPKLARVLSYCLHPKALMDTLIMHPSWCGGESWTSFTPTQEHRIEFESFSLDYGNVPAENLQERDAPLHPSQPPYHCHHHKPTPPQYTQTPNMLSAGPLSLFVTSHSYKPSSLEALIYSNTSLLSPTTMYF